MDRVDPTFRNSSNNPLPSIRTSWPSSDIPSNVPLSTTPSSLRSTTTVTNVQKTPFRSGAGIQHLRPVVSKDIPQFPIRPFQRTLQKRSSLPARVSKLSGITYNRVVLSEISTKINLGERSEGDPYPYSLSGHAQIADPHAKMCETCSGVHDGSFGAGRFCSSRCARTVGGLAHRRKRLLERKAKTQVDYNGGDEGPLRKRYLPCAEVKALCSDETNMQPTADLPHFDSTRLQMSQEGKPFSFNIYPEDVDIHGIRLKKFNMSIASLLNPTDG